MKLTISIFTAASHSCKHNTVLPEWRAISLHYTLMILGAAVIPAISWRAFCLGLLPKANASWIGTPLICDHETVTVKCQQLRLFNLEWYNKRKILKNEVNIFYYPFRWKRQCGTELAVQQWLPFCSKTIVVGWEMKMCINRADTSKLVVKCRFK